MGHISGFDVSQDVVRLELGGDLAFDYANGCDVTGGREVNVLNVSAGVLHNAVIVPADQDMGTNFLQFTAAGHTAASSHDMGYSFADTFLEAIGSGGVQVGTSGVSMLATVYDATNQQAILFEINSGSDSMINAGDVASMEIVTTIGMSSNDYGVFGTSGFGGS